MRLSSKRLGPAGLAVAGALVVLAIIGVLFFTKRSLVFRSTLRLVDESSYQAVFLDNEQVYFGKLSRSQYPLLSDVYYVQLAGGENAGGAASGRLVKLGETEAHGPVDQMILNPEHILFWENLKQDSKVMQLIRDHKSKE